MGAPPRHRVALWKRLLFGALTTVAVIGGAEGVLRLTFPVVRAATLPDREIAAHVDSVGLRWDADLLWYWESLPQGDFNAQGFRADEPTPREPPAGVLRAIATGDSQTLGAGVTTAAAYPAIADARLGERWEVLNAAVNGYKSLNVYRQLQLVLAAYHPDAVVVDCVPFDSPRDDGPVQALPLGAGALDRLLWHSRLYYALRFARDKARINRPRWLDTPGDHTPRDPSRLGNHDLIQGWGEDHGVAVLFLEYPAMETWGETLECMTHPGDLPPGAIVVPACQALEATGYPAVELFVDRNHLTERGNRIVGRALADTLRGLELP